MFGLPAFDPQSVAVQTKLSLMFTTVAQRYAKEKYTNVLEEAMRYQEFKLLYIYKENAKEQPHQLLLRSMLRECDLLSPLKGLDFQEGMTKKLNMLLHIIRARLKIFRDCLNSHRVETNAEKKKAAADRIRDLGIDSAGKDRGE